MYVKLVNMLDFDLKIYIHIRKASGVMFNLISFAFHFMIFTIKAPLFGHKILFWLSFE